MRVRIDHERCTGHGRCYALAPEVFEPDDLGQGRVIGDGEVPPGLEGAARRAVANCPEEAVIAQDTA
jgi:ferredoxin